MSRGYPADRTLAVIGCGAVVEEVYALSFGRLSETGWMLRLVDSDAGRARDIAQRFRGAEAVESVDKVVGRASHAIVATPPASHYSICRQLLDAGIHVLCEKPFVLYPSDGESLVEQAARAGLKLQVNQTRRWYPASLVARGLLAVGAVGEVTTVSLREGTRFDWPARTAFHSQPGLARHGILSDLGAHTFDLIGWILDRQLEPVDVQHDGYAGPEATVRVKFTSGAVAGDAVMTWLVDVSPQLQFIGTTGRIIIDDNCNRALVQIGSEFKEMPGMSRYNSYQSIVRDVVEVFVNGTDHPGVASARSVMPSVVFLDRAYRMGKAKLPLVTDLGGARS